MLHCICLADEGGGLCYLMTSLMSFNQNYKADKNVPDMSFMMEVSV